jgi:glycosyltransferase involved in cell wall biosynthesis
MTEARDILRVSVVIPAYRVKDQILQVLGSISPAVHAIYVVDDCCPEGSGHHVTAFCSDSRVTVLFHEQNRGVGGATLTGYRHALADGADIIVKLDGDGQMDPALIPMLIRPIEQGDADYTKGNRFYNLSDLTQMPFLRLLGNSALSFMAKFSAGYWNIFDPTNGFTAIHAAVAERLPFAKIDQRYFFESDLLFRLNTLRAVVIDIPMTARYGEEQSSLKISRVIPEFLGKHFSNLLKRIFYNYFLRDFSVASVEIICSIILLMFGGIFGLRAWVISIKTGIVASSGTVMLAALPVLAGLQMLIAFLSADVNNVPKYPLQKLLLRL